MEINKGGVLYGAAAKLKGYTTFGKKEYYFCCEEYSKKFDELPEIFIKG